MPLQIAYLLLACATAGVALGYRRTDRRVHEFEGIGTIRGIDGRNLEVRIVFAPQRRDTSVYPQEALASARLGLNGRCRP